MDEAARENLLEEPKLCSINAENHRYVFFDHSGHSITAFSPKPETHFGNVVRMKRMAVDALQKARAERTNAVVVEILSAESSEHSEISNEDSEFSRRHHRRDILDDEQCIDDLLYDEGVRKKVELLAGMVGVESSKPGVVLAEVVRVLKGLERRKQMSQLK